MWVRIAGFIVRNRIPFLIAIILVTGFFGWYAKDVELLYGNQQLIPLSDTDYVAYREFQEQFGEDGDVMTIGFQARDVFSKSIYNDWKKLTQQIKEIEGVRSVTSIANIVKLERDTARRQLSSVTLKEGTVKSEDEADSLRREFLSQPFYDGLIYNDSSQATLMAVRIDPEVLKTVVRVGVMKDIRALGDAFSAKHKVEMHYSGLPYIRTTFSHKIQDELNLFLILSAAISALILLIFFRSFYAVIFPLIIITIIVIWTLGLIVLFGYKLNLLTGLIPPLIVIIAVPNFIYFLTQYHTEYRKYRNKYMAISRMLKNIALVVFLNNFTTAIGFGVLYFVDSPLLREFGLVAFIVVSAIFVATLILLPIVFSYLPAPSTRQTTYLDNKWITKYLDKLHSLVKYRRKWVYALALLTGVVSIMGLTRLKAVGYLLDDIPKRNKLYQDVVFFEDHFKGVMPFEIVIDTERERGLLDEKVLKAMERFQDTIEAMPEFGRTLSIVDVAKFARQGFYNNQVSRYGLPTRSDLIVMKPYLSSLESAQGSAMSLMLVDSALSKARITTRMEDVGSVRLEQIVNELRPKVNQIFSGTGVSYRFTGNSLVFLKGNTYLVDSLVTSLAMAIALIALIIGLLFRSVRLVVFVMIPNLLALLITAGIMGWFGIPLKPSTILVFSIAFGIAVDASFHFLARYRQDLKLHNWNVAHTVKISLEQTGFSIIFTSIVLFFGFGIFCFSTFGSTVSLGALTSITVIIAMFTNLILIPALLLEFDKKNPKANQEKRPLHMEVKM